MRRGGGLSFYVRTGSVEVEIALISPYITIPLQDIPPSGSPINPRNGAGIQQGRMPSIYGSLEFGGRGPGGGLALPGHGEVQAPDSIRDIRSNGLDRHRNQGIASEVCGRNV